MRQAYAILLALLVPLAIALPVVVEDLEVTAQSCQYEPAPSGSRIPGESGYFTPSEWKLQTDLPECDASGKVKKLLEVYPDKMGTYESSGFYVNGTDDALTFITSATGYMTRNAHYPRQELRHMVYWSLTNGRHVMRARMAVQGLPAVGKRVTIAQIKPQSKDHISCDDDECPQHQQPFIKIKASSYRSVGPGKFRLEALVKMNNPENPDDETGFDNKDKKMNLGTFSLGEYFDVEIAYEQSEQLKLTVSVTPGNAAKIVKTYDYAGVLPFDRPDKHDRMYYFKIGSYCSSNAKKIQKGWAGPSWRGVHSNADLPRCGA
jgi:hypothetical protein